jgi:hypothetical protein
MDRVQIINYLGKRIVYLDFSNLQTKIEIEIIAREAKTFIHNQPPLSVLSLTNIEGMHFNNEIRDIFTDLAKGNKPYVKTGAIVGVTGLKQILFNAVMVLSGRDLKSFSTLDQAKNWLAKQN